MLIFKAISVNVYEYCPANVAGDLMEKYKRKVRDE